MLQKYSPNLTPQFVQTWATFKRIIRENRYHKKEKHTVSIQIKLGIGIRYTPAALYHKLNKQPERASQCKNHITIISC